MVDQHTRDSHLDGNDIATTTEAFDQLETTEHHTTTCALHALEKGLIPQMLYHERAANHWPRVFDGCDYTNQRTGNVCTSRGPYAINDAEDEGIETPPEETSYLYGSTDEKSIQPTEKGPVSDDTIVQSGSSVFSEAAHAPENDNENKDVIGESEKTYKQSVTEHQGGETDDIEDFTTKDEFWDWLHEKYRREFLAAMRMKLWSEHGSQEKQHQ